MSGSVMATIDWQLSGCTICTRSCVASDTGRGPVSIFGRCVALQSLWWIWHPQSLSNYYFFGSLFRLLLSTSLLQDRHSIPSTPCSHQPFSNWESLYAKLCTPFKAPFRLIRTSFKSWRSDWYASLTIPYMYCVDIRSITAGVRWHNRLAWNCGSFSIPNLMDTKRHAERSPRCKSTCRAS